MELAVPPVILERRAATVRMALAVLAARRVLGERVPWQMPLPCGTARTERSASSALPAKAAVAAAVAVIRNVLSAITAAATAVAVAVAVAGAGQRVWAALMAVARSLFTCSTQRPP